ncbi:MAG: GGDEF domain-containing protein [Solirubrobacteraceae bacterium]|jgi:diguanylate cyclase (GGDEF)-like protein
MPASAAALIADVFHPARTAPVGLDRRLEAFSVLLEHHPDAPVSAFEASGAPVPVPASVAVGARPTLVHNGMRAVVFIDLDGFKQVNDRLGHAAGDELLRVVGRELRECCRREDIVGRIGGDEFLVVCPGIGSADAALGLAQRLAVRLSATVERASADTARRVSVGVSWSRGDALGADALVAAADRAMYASEREGLGRARFEADAAEPQARRPGHGRSRGGAPSAP